MKTVEIEIPIGYEIDKEKSTFEKIVFKKIKSKWVDLGLPSGNLWKDANEDGYFTYNNAVEKFKDNLPTIVDFAELVHYCKWEWSSKLKGMIVTGPNKNYIVFPFNGFRDYDTKSLCNVDSGGYYISISSDPSYNNIAYGLCLDSSSVDLSNYTKRSYGYSIRCVKHK